MKQYEDHDKNHQSEPIAPRNLDPNSNDSLDFGKTPSPIHKAIDNEEDSVDYNEIIEEEYQFADDDSIGPEIAMMTLREIRVPPIMTRQKTEELDKDLDNNDLTDIIDDGIFADNSMMKSGFGLKPSLDPGYDDRQLEAGKSNRMPARSILSQGSTQISAFCLSKDEKYAYLVSPDAHLFRVPLAILLTTSEYSAYLVARLPLQGSVTDVLDLGQSVVVSANNNLVIVSQDQWRVVLDHRLDGRETAAPGYRMASRRLGSTRKSGETLVSWWATQTSVLIFSVEQCRLVARESLAVKGKIRPGITGDARCYYGIN